MRQVVNQITCRGPQDPSPFGAGVYAQQGARTPRRWVPGHRGPSTLAPVTSE